MKNSWYFFFPASISLAYVAGVLAEKNPVAAFMVAMAAAGCIVGALLTR